MGLCDTEDANQEADYVTITGPPTSSLEWGVAWHLLSPITEITIQTLGVYLSLATKAGYTTKLAAEPKC